MKIQSLPKKNGKFCYEIQADDGETEILELDNMLPEGILHIHEKPTPKPEKVKKEFTIFGHKPDYELEYNLFLMVLVYYWIFNTNGPIQFLWIFIGMPMFGMFMYNFIKRYHEIKNEVKK
jgi:hypothetical protein